MWKRGGQSTALDRAQALLSGKKSSREVGQSSQGTRDRPTLTRPAPPDSRALYSDLSDLSSLSSALEDRADPMGFSATEKNPETNGYSKDLKPLVSAGSRFLKKVPPPVTNSSQSPVIRSHKQSLEPRHVSSSQRSSQSAVLSRLAQIESRIHSHMQPQEHAREGPQPVHSLTSQPPKVVTQSHETSSPLPISAQSSDDQNSRGKRFLKSKASAAVESPNTAAAKSLKGQESGVRSWSRAAAVTAAVPLGGVLTKSVKVAHGVSLESDEEDMRELLGDSLNSTNSYSRPERKSSVKLPEKKPQSKPPSASVQPLSSNIAPPRSPNSQFNCSSPFRFTSQAQSQFSPSAISPSPSPPCLSPTPSTRLSPHRRMDSPKRSGSAMSGQSNVMSLEELFPVQPVSEDLQSVMSVVSSEDFNLNVMSLDDLVPATLGFTDETPGIQLKEHSSPLAESPKTPKALPGDKKAPQQQQEEKEEEKEEEDMLDYQSDFESEIQTEQNYSADQVSEELVGDEDEVKAASEVREEALDTDVSHGRTEDDYSSTLSDPRRSSMSRTSDCSDASESLSGRRDSRSSASRGSRASSHPSSRRPAARRVLKKPAAQRQPETMAHTSLSGMSTSGPALGVTYMNPTSVALHTLSADAVQALSTYNPAAFVLNQLLKQQLATTRQFIESSRRLHDSLVRSLEPPNYRYTTLEDTKEYIRMHRPPRLTMEQALKEVMLETKEYNCTV